MTAQAAPDGSMSMRKTSLVTAVSAVVFALGTGLFAQGQRATIVMRSGESHPALNIGYFDSRGLIVRTSFEQEPTFPIDQVAYIDFGGGAAPASVPAAPHAVVKKDGSVVTGTVTRIAHVSDDQSTPWNVSITTPSGPQTISSNDISRIYFSPSSTAVGTAGQAASASGVADMRVVTLDGKQQGWIPTGITVRRGQVVRFNATGQVTLSLNPGDDATPSGVQRTDPASPMPQTATGALIGRINNGRPFGIGSQTQVTMPESGQLFLGINDSSFSDNAGAFRVEISR